MQINTMSSSAHNQNKKKIKTARQHHATCSQTDFQHQSSMIENNNGIGSFFAKDLAKKYLD